MARAIVAKTTLEGAYGDYGAGEADVVLTAADVANFNYAMFKTGDIVIAHNTDVAAQTVTITSIEDDQGRTGNIATYSLAADDIAVFGPFERNGWMQDDGQLYMRATSANVKLGVITGASVRG